MPDSAARRPPADRALNLRADSPTVASFRLPASMTPFRRLLSCLCVLALLAGTPVQARMAMARDHAHAAPAAGQVPAADAGDCHGGGAAVPAPRHDEGPTGTADCCPDMPGHHDCGSACTCPAAAPAVAVKSPDTGTPMAVHTAWSAPRHAGRTGVSDGPPTPPPRI